MRDIETSPFCKFLNLVYLFLVKFPFDLKTWETIEKAKTLSDRNGFMAKRRLRCIGLNYGGLQLLKKLSPIFCNS